MIGSCLNSKSLVIPVNLTNGIKIHLIIYSQSKEVALNKIDEAEALANGESPYQLKEGFFYEYKISEGYNIKEIPKIVSQSQTTTHTGRITPNIYVGTLTLEILDNLTNIKFGQIAVEVCSIKTSYRSDYRYMLESITERCTDLLMQINSPVSQNFTIDSNLDSESIYQRFAFIKSILESQEFNEAIHRILTAPVTTWAQKDEEQDISKIKRIKPSIINQIVSKGNRIAFSLQQDGRQLLTSLPAKVKLKSNEESLDTSENRFIKHALTTFLQFCTEVRHKVKEESRDFKEVLALEELLENILNHSIFQEISRLNNISLNNPVLQRKEGYREVFRAWLMFDLAAKLIWKGGEDVYQAGKRDVAILYEYWLFFTLLDLLKDIFKIEPKSLQELIEQTGDGLGLKLKSGVCTAITGIYSSSTRKLNIEFCYNRSFTRNSDHQKSGSWTTNMRPDYTLSIWPAALAASEAESQELMVHIHFDAKYKISNLSDLLIDLDINLDEEKAEQNQGIYKRVDLLKMHAYKDAIRRTAGAYILYPGSKSLNRKGFHEILPGLGAFPISPSQSGNGISEIKQFINEVVRHFLDRSSQMERISYKSYNTYKEKNIGRLNETIPELINGIRITPPDETSVLIGYYKNQAHRDWIEKTGLYNARMNNVRGSLHLGPHEAGADYLLLHSKKLLITNDLLRIKTKGPRIYSKKQLVKKGYPDPTQEFYLVYEVETAKSVHFGNVSWDIRNLEQYRSGQGSALPFGVSLTNLMAITKK